VIDANVGCDILISGLKGDGVMKIAVKRLIRDEKGQALAVVLVLVLVSGLIVGPLMANMGNGLLNGRVYERGTAELYAADAGVEDALWRIKHIDLTDFLSGYDEYDYSSNWTYNLSATVNDKNVHVTMENVWMPKDIPAPNATIARQIIEAGELIITSNIYDAGASKYQIKISYDKGCSGPGNATVNSVGIWLPAGFQYVMGSSDLEKAGGKPYYSVPTVSVHKGGYAVVWNFGSPVTVSGFPANFIFQYSGPQGQIPSSAVSWIKINATPYYTWDANIKIYEIISTATDPNTGTQTTVESYSSTTSLRKLGSAISGDYVAIGNSLLTPTGDVNYRNRLYKESSATIQRTDPNQSWNYIPPTATIEAAYLYWVGWIDYHYWYKSGSTWYWNPSSDTGAGGVPELNYNNYASNLSQLIANAKVTTVSFGGGSNFTDITANQCRVVEATDSPGEHVWDGTWSYTCVYDATNIVKSLITNNVSTFTLGHASHGSTSVINVLRPGYPGLPGGSNQTNYYSFSLYNTSYYTGYPLGFPAMKLPSGESNYKERYIYAYCGWSLIIIYSIPQTEIKNQLYLYDITDPNFEFKEAWGPAGIHEPDFDDDGSPGGTITSFLVPAQVTNETNVAKMTCFVGEGDVGITGDYFKVTGPSGTGAKLWDGITCNGNSAGNPNNVWNSQSLVVQVPGVDIDTFYVTWSSNVLKTGDTWAQIDPYTDNDGFTLIYIILSFRSSITSGGTIGYLIKG
jgi:hypothetical protein